MGELIFTVLNKLFELDARKTFSFAVMLFFSGNEWLEFDVEFANDVKIEDDVCSKLIGIFVLFAEFFVFKFDFDFLLFTLDNDEDEDDMSNFLLFLAFDEPDKIEIVVLLPFKLIDSVFFFMYGELSANQIKIKRVYF